MDLVYRIAKVIQYIITGLVCTFCIVLILFFFTPVGALGIIAFESTLVKWDIDNPHVNSDFRNWRNVAVSFFGSIQIPADWNLVEEDGIVTIVADGMVWAQGVVFGSPSARFADVREMMAWMTGNEGCEVDFEAYIGSQEMDGSCVGRFLMADESSQYTYFIRLESYSGNTSSTLYLILEDDLQEEPDQHDVAEAIVFAWAYDT